MSPADSPESGHHADPQVLAALALEDTADLSAIELHAVHAHLAGCAECAAEVASLRATLALARDGADEALLAPPPGVWQAISAETGGEARQPAEEAGDAAAVRQLSRDQETRRRGVPAWLAGLAAAVTLIAGLGVGYALAPGAAEESPAPQPEVLSSAALASLDEEAADRGSAQVRRDGDRVVLHVEAAGLGAPKGIREVWLINLDGTRMVALGLLSNGESGDFEFPKRLLDEGYRIVDISYEPDDGDPVHSGRSLARGTLEG